MEQENKKKSKIIIIFLIIIIVILLGALCFEMFNDRNNKNTKINNTNKTEEKINVDDYNELMKNLLNYECGFKSELIDKNYTIDNMPEEYMLSASVNSSETKQYKLEEKTFEALNKDYKTLKEENKNGYIPGIPSSTIKENYKKLFNKNIELPEEIKDYVYIKELDAYFYNSVVCGPEIILGNINYKAEKEGNKLYIYTKFYLDDLSDSGMLYDYGIQIKNSEGEISKTNPLKQVEMNEIDSYVKQNLDKFTTYKFTFELNNSHYIYQKFEKQ